MIASSVRMKRVRKKSHSGRPSTGQVRVIGGQWRGRKLPVSDALGLRPTTDRNKETLFNWLMHQTTDARCLDVFAGSGGLGIEALSRYAACCLFFEKDKEAARQLESNLATLNANGKVLQGDALALLGEQSGPFDIVFVDPPFKFDLVKPTLALIQQNNLVCAGSVIYLEQEPDAPLPELPGHWQVTKHKQSSGLQYLLIEVLPT
ncbi:16S rRNA (guanine(966)-N(2))-methyltransferase RsmD [Salinimonas iocasae]|uniref:Ribosomal RNA small subunit methyltransferase D n=2 Tax=Salinimonas iocasae TaxID=2572577 RepID=A0A5B7Y9L7_9ALTE|nr:16S rRNA (guanine(966)-N(2))-methyltransferase RsmD [Salinimonas iocasae]QCZ92331.1 16S rRNA (guanine(966)-N(2))-methyltransferase RsmD [Salinimonas iocasae]